MTCLKFELNTVRLSACIISKLLPNHLSIRGWLAESCAKYTFYYLLLPNDRTNSRNHKALWHFSQSSNLFLVYISALTSLAGQRMTLVSHQQHNCEFVHHFSLPINQYSLITSPTYHEAPSFRQKSV